MKKYVLLFITVLISVSLFAFPAHAEADRTGLIENVKITEDGTITFDGYPQATDYWLGINGGYLPTENGANCADRFNFDGTYELLLEAYIDGSLKTADWCGVVSVKDGKITLTYSDNDPDSVFLLKKSTDGGSEIKNIRMYKSGKILWDDVEGAEYYYITKEIFTTSLSNGARIDMSELLQGENSLAISAADSDTAIFAEYKFTVTVNGATINVDDEKTFEDPTVTGTDAEEITDGIQTLEDTQTAEDATVEYDDGKDYETIAKGEVESNGISNTVVVVCIAVTAVAVAALAVVTVLLIKAKKK